MWSPEKWLERCPAELSQASRHTASAAAAKAKAQHIIIAGWGPDITDLASGRLHLHRLPAAAPAILAEELLPTGRSLHGLQNPIGMVP